MGGTWLRMFGHLGTLGGFARKVIPEHLLAGMRARGTAFELPCSRIMKDVFY